MILSKAIAAKGQVMTTEIKDLVYIGGIVVAVAGSHFMLRAPRHGSGRTHQGLFRGHETHFRKPEPHRGKARRQSG